MSDWVSLIASLERIADALEKQNAAAEIDAQATAHTNAVLMEMNERQAVFLSDSRDSHQHARKHEARCEEVHRRLCEAAGIPYDAEETLN